MYGSEYTVVCIKCSVYGGVVLLVHVSVHCCRVLDSYM